MKIIVCSAAAMVLLGVGLAQQQKPAQTEAPQTTSPAAQSSDTTSKSGSASSMPEMKTQKYKGTLMDASCAGGGSSSAAATGSTSSSSSTSTSSSAPADTAKKQGEASRSAGDQSSCTVSANTTQFALKMKDGQTVRFDSVGNDRAQRALKEKKKWTEAVSANKPIQATVSGVIMGDKLTVVSIN